MKRKKDLDPRPPLNSPLNSPETSYADAKRHFPDQQQDPSASIFVGIDWADSQHEFALLGPDGSLHQGSVDQNAQALAEFLDTWRKTLGRRHVVLCIETSAGPIINALLEHDDVTIYPVNPLALAKYREAFAPGGGKNDRVDARLILQYLTHYRDQLRPLQPDSPATRTLRRLTRDRRDLVEQRVEWSLRLMALLKAFFPAALAMKPAKPYADFLVHLIARYPSLEAVRKAGRCRIRKLFFAKGTTAQIEKRLQVLFEAQPLTTDAATIETSGMMAQAIARQLLALNQTIRTYDARIKATLAVHPRQRTFRTLPCGLNSQARIIAALGDDLQRFGSAEELSSATGIAPLTIQSGKSRFVSSRWAASKFLRQTFHEFAGVASNRCPWSKAFYESQIKKGKTARIAKRALAYKWIRIIFRCWQTSRAYDQTEYLARLALSGSPLANRLASSLKNVS